MNTATQRQSPNSELMSAATAADLMTPNPISIEGGALMSEAVVLLTERGFSAAPVIDETGRPVGVVSRTDLLVHDRELAGSLAPADWYDEAELKREIPAKERAGLHLQHVDATHVRDIMTPVVFCVAPEESAAKAVEQMVRLNVHRLFVVDADGVLVGVISALDVLRFLSGE
jgi:CBS domain-containing protein